MSFLFNNMAVLVVAAVASAVVWVFGGTRGELLVLFVPWLFALMIEVLYFFPQRRSGETSYDARERVWRSLKKDPLMWVSVGFMLIMMIPFVNNGLCPNCDAAKIAQGIKAEPPIPFIPFCVNRLDHLNVVLWFATALPAMIMVRHSLNRNGQRLVLEMIVWNGVAVALLGFIQSASGAPGPLWSTAHGLLRGSVGDFFATFGYPNMAGDYFTTLCGISVALWRYHLDEVNEERRQLDVSKLAGKKRDSFWRKHYMLIATVICFYAAINTLSRAALILVSLSSFVYFVHSFISLTAKMHRAQRVWAGAWSALALIIIVFFSSLFEPAGLQREVDTINTTEVLDRVTGRGQYHARVATEIWKDNLMFGCGGWGYVHFCVPKMTPEERKQIQRVGGINVHNDYLQFLAEHGIVGFGALVAMVVILLWPIVSGWRKLVKQSRFLRGNARPPKPIQIFALPASVFFILITTVATLVHAFGDCPLRSPAVLTLFFVSLAALPGFMPKGEED